MKYMRTLEIPVGRTLFVDIDFDTTTQNRFADLD